MFNSTYPVLAVSKYLATPALYLPTSRTVLLIQE
jgi:hypothetical protein